MTLARFMHDPQPHPGMVGLRVWGWRCLRCDHAWMPREDRPPRVCPRCKTPYWDLPRSPTS